MDLLWSRENLASKGFHHNQFIGCYLFLFGAYGVLLPFLPLYFSSLGISYRSIGVLSMIPNIAAFTCAPLWSYVADLNMRSEVMLLTTFISVALAIMFFECWSLGYIYVIVAVWSVFRAPVSSLIDSVVMIGLKDSVDYGKMRLWGAVGFGIFSFLGGLLTSGNCDQPLGDSNNNCSKSLCYRPLFTAYIVLGLLTVAVLWTMRKEVNAAVSSRNLDHDKQTEVEIEMGSKVSLEGLEKGETKFQSSSSSSHVDLLISTVRSQPSVLLFALVVFISGMGTGVIETFLFIRLKELGASEFVMGCARFLTCAAEVPMFQIASILQRKIGIWRLVSITQAAFIVRFLYYSALQTPWFVLPAELLHGFTYAVTWSVACSYATLISPPQIQATMLAFLESIHWGLGGVGSVIGGIVYRYYGAVVLFQGCAVMCGVSCLIAVLCCMTCPEPHPPKPKEQEYVVVLESSVHGPVADCETICESRTTGQ